TIRLPFGRAVEQYLYSLLISHSIRYKVQSKKRVNDAVKQGLITVECVEDQCKSTNRLDDVLQLTKNGKHRVQQIRANEESGCQRSCGGIGKCVETCNHYANEHNIDTDFPVHMIIKRNHVLQNIIQEKTVPSQINLSRELLASHNSASQNELEHLYHQHFICDELKLHQLIERDNLRTRRQVDTNAPENSLERYYQLTLSDDLWLQQARDFGFFCFSIDGKYDLNSNGALILSLVVEDNARYGMPIAFRVSNKENNYTIRLAIEAVQRNVPCNNFDCLHEYHYEDLSNGKGFMRVRNCAPIWQLFAMIDKHRPTKRGLQPILHGLILCWFYIMQTFSVHLKDLRIDNRYWYPIAIAFKIVGRSRSKEEALELGEAYKTFIKFLPLTEIAKEFFGRMPLLNDVPGVRPMTTNNLTERMNKSIEGQRIGTQPINHFIERLYGITLV
ncbi:21718_t:CDS:2, partial [Cetraspora pellucida]